MKEEITRYKVSNQTTATIEWNDYYSKFQLIHFGPFGITGMGFFDTKAEVADHLRDMAQAWGGFTIEDNSYCKLY